MNYLKEIQILKTELALPLQKAKTLLEQTAGDIPAAIALYHQENIATIMAETECEHWEAENVYERFNYNVEKAVKHIFSTSLTISVEDKRDTNERGMGYLVSALDADLNNVSKRSIFIPIEDFDEYLYTNPSGTKSKTISIVQPAISLTPPRAEKSSHNCANVHLLMKK